MAQPELNHRLTSVDASFLYFERKEAPLHIGGISIFEREIPYKDFLEHVSSKMPLLPRYRQKAIPSPLNLGHPTWEYDSNFDIRRHVIHAQLPEPGTLKQLQQLAETLECTMLDRNKPLWELHVVQGYEGNRTALISKIHHAMVDGVSGVDLMKIIMDISPDPAPTEIPEIPPDPPLPDPTRRAIDSIVDSLQDGMKGLMDFQNNLLNLAQTWAKTPGPRITPPDSMLTNLLTPVSLLSFNKGNTGKMRLGWHNFAFAEARGIRGVFGGTVNDVVLTTLSGAIIKYLEFHKQKVSGRTLRVMVPVSMRKEDQRGALGNLVSVLPVEIPLDLPNNRERHDFLIKRTGALKGARVAEGINMFSALMGTVPPSIQAVVGSLATTPVPPFNIVSTNVPGPQIPLYVLGRKMTQSYPFVPVGFGLGVSCAILSYDQQLYFGITADAQALPDMDKLIEFLGDTFTALREEAGVAEFKTKVETPLPAKARTRTRPKKTEAAKVATPQ